MSASQRESRGKSASGRLADEATLDAFSVSLAGKCHKMKNDDIADV